MSSTQTFRTRALRNVWKVHRRLIGDRLTTYHLDKEVVIDYPINSMVGLNLYTGQFEKDEINFIKCSLKKGDVVLDIGANAGIFSVIASRIVGDAGHVYAFEIGPQEVKLLKHNINKNKSSNVTVMEYAVSNQNGNAKFALAVDGAMNSLAKNDHPAQKIKEWISVKTIRLNDWAKQFGVSRVDAIKMDVEGAEKLVFEGGMQILKQWKPRFILFESLDNTASGFGYTALDLINLLRKEGFIIYALNGSDLEKINNNEVNNHYNFVAVPAN